MPLEFTKTFVLSDEKLDRHSQRLLMDGAEYENFSANPVMLFNHLRASKGFFSDPDRNQLNLPIGRWENIRRNKRTKQILADAWLDMDDAFAAQIASKINNGVLNAASVGLRPIAVSDDPELKVKGQKGLTITQWELMEASVVDIPANPRALAISKSLLSKAADGEVEVESEEGYIRTFFTSNSKAMNEEKKTLQERVLSWAEKLGLVAKSADEVFDIIENVEAEKAGEAAEEKAAETEVEEEVTAEASGASEETSEATEEEAKAETEEKPEEEVEAEVEAEKAAATPSVSLEEFNAIKAQVKSLGEGLKEVANAAADLAKAVADLQDNAVEAEAETEEKTAEVTAEVTALKAEIARLKGLKSGKESKAAEGSASKTVDQEEEKKPEVLVASNSDEFIKNYLNGSIKHLNN